jgi:iron complex outermembrane receptor protein
MARTLLVCAFACLALALPPLAAAQASRTKAYPLDIARLPLTRALEHLNQQTQVYYVYMPASPEEEQILVGPLKGDFRIDAALTELLKATELTYEWTGTKNVSILRRPTPPKPPPAAPAKQPRTTWRTPKVAPGAERGGGILETVVTTGSAFRSLPGPTSDGYVFDSDWIQGSGLTTVAEVLRLIPQQPFLRPDGFRSNGAQYAELRGLGADTTLILLNGRRAFASAGSFTTNAFDLNQVPLSAVERVEVQLDSISVRHGADAIGGVVNVVLRDDIQSPSIEARYGAAAGGAVQGQASFSAGYQGEKVRAALIMDYRSLSPLVGADRDLWSNQDYRRYGSDDRRSTVSSPANIFALPGMVLPGGAPFAAIPQQTAGPITQPDEFRPFSLNTESLLQYSPIVPEDERASAVASLQVDLTPTVTAATDLMIVDRKVVFTAVPAVVAGVVVPQTNPYNTLNQPVVVTGLLNGADPLTVTLDAQLIRGSGSLRGKLMDWDWELSLLRSEEDAQATIENGFDPVDPADQLRLMMAVNDPDPDRALNLLTPGPAASREVLAQVLRPPEIQDFSTDATQLMGAMTGKPFALPAGDAKMIVGTEWRREEVEFDLTVGATAREVAGGFAELQLPLINEDMKLPAARDLTLTVAGRFDRYTDFGEVFSPQFGLVWRPLREVAVRSTYGRSFRAPSLYDLYLPAVSAPVPIVDFRRNGEQYSTIQVASGSRDLEATRGESFAAGVDFSPEAISGLQMSATYWRVAMSNRVTTLNPVFAVAHESQFADRIHRAEPTVEEQAAGLPGRIVEIDVMRANFGRLTTSGVDIGANYAVETEAGRFAADLKATWIDKYETVDVPGQTALDRVNVASSLGTIAKWRAVTSLDWTRDPFKTTAYVRYIPGYDDTRDGVRNGRTIPSQTFVDLQISLDCGKLLGDSPLLRGVEFSAGALNVFDELPHFAEVNGAQGYDTSQGDLKGRFWYLRLGKTF